MDRIDLFKCLCYEGNVENTGVFETEDNPCDECAAMFGTGYSQMLIDGILKPNAQYIYVYNYRLTHPQKGEQGADIVIRISEGRMEDFIYLYEIE